MATDGLVAILVLDLTATKEPGAHIMDNHAAQPSMDSSPLPTDDRPATDRSLPATRHPILSRLMEEVRNEHTAEAGYDRVHNRHNRAGR